MSIPKILLATLALSSSLAFAQGIVLNDQNLRTDLNWLNQQGVKYQLKSKHVFITKTL